MRITIKIRKLTWYGDGSIGTAMGNALHDLVSFKARPPSTMYVCM